ncbi:MAG: dipeptidase [Candidatus Kapabacteria bacterium]|jgi:acetylornithine deacetylase/succinyl-diaminopimelate desuccinylase-like protein|nr:dipeptidase [Candidatus Kapabacteria bacterium]
MNALDFLANRYNDSLQELTTFLAIPSVSTDVASANDVSRCAVWLADHIRHTGFPDVRIIETAGHPIVYAEDLSAGPEKPTVLFYGHYDVQPVDPLHLWTNPPFEPTIRDGKVFARGATDDKGQVFLHIKALEALRATTGSLPLNVKLLIEGEEEIGSPNLAPFVENNATMLQCDAIVVSDTPMMAPGIPSLVYGLRGLAYLQIDVTGPNRDLHSGSYGGAVNNPLNALAHIIAQLKDEHGRIRIPGFYDDVLELSLVEREELAALGYDDTVLMNDVGTTSLFGEQGYTTPERLWARPTLDVNGLLGGFTGEGAKTVLPSKAMAKISMRLVPHQRTADIAAKFQAYVETLVPPGITVTVRDLHGADPVLVPRDTPAMHAAVRALEATFGQTCRFTREGGSIPVVLLFDTVLKSPTVLMGFGLNNENAHSPDEHFSLENFRHGMDAAVRFYQDFGTITP